MKQLQLPHADSKKLKIDNDSFIVKKLLIYSGVKCVYSKNKCQMQLAIEICFANLHACLGVDSIVIWLKHIHLSFFSINWCSIYAGFQSIVQASGVGLVLQATHYLLISCSYFIIAPAFVQFCYIATPFTPLLASQLIS